LIADETHECDLDEESPAGAEAASVKLDSATPTFTTGRTFGAQMAATAGTVERVGRRGLAAGA